MDEVKKSIDLGGLALRPLPTEMFDKVICTNCRATQARWEVARSAELSWSYACSCCFLYEVPLMRAQRALLESLISAVELERREVFERDEGGRISNAKADLVLFGVVLADRVLRANRQKGSGLNVQ